MKIYGFNTPNVHKVVYTAEKLGTRYEYIPVNLLAGEQRKPEHLDRHCWGMVPALEIEGECLIESNAICRHLARIGDSPLYPHHPMAAARVDEMIDMIVLHPGRALGTFFFEEVVKAGFMQQDPDPAALEAAQKQLNDQLPAIDSRLSCHTFLCGDQLTIADTIAVPVFATAQMTSVDLSAFPHLQAWLERAVSRPAWKRTLKVCSEGMPA